MLPAEITSTAAKPRMILARNLRVGNMVRLDGDAIRPDIPTPTLCSCNDHAARKQPFPNACGKLRQKRQGAVNPYDLQRGWREFRPQDASNLAGAEGRRVAANRKTPYSLKTWR